MTDDLGPLLFDLAADKGMVSLDPDRQGKVAGALAAIESACPGTRARLAEGLRARLGRNAEVAQADGSAH